MKKRCIIYVVAAVALRAQVLCVRGASAQSCGLVAPVELGRCFFVLWDQFLHSSVVLGDGTIGGVLQIYHASSNGIMI